MFHFRSICCFVFALDVSIFLIFRWESVSWVMKWRIHHKLILDHFHSFHYGLSISFSKSYDVNMCRSKIELLFSTFGLFTYILWIKLFKFLFQFFIFFELLILFSLFFCKLFISFFLLSSSEICIIFIFSFSSSLCGLLWLSLHKSLNNTSSLFIFSFKFILGIRQNFHSSLWDATLVEHWILLSFYF